MWVSVDGGLKKYKIIKYLKTRTIRFTNNTTYRMYLFSYIIRLLVKFLIYKYMGGESNSLSFKA